MPFIFILTLENDESFFFKPSTKDHTGKHSVFIMYIIQKK